MREREAAFEAERAHLFAVAYRMVASASEAEDIVQEAWLRFDAQEGPIDSPRAFLTTIVVRLTLDHLKSARVQRETYVGPWLPEPIAEHTPESHTALAESLSLAFLVLLERLSPLERAAFLLREVFGHDVSDVANILGTTEAACRKLVTRARVHVDEGKARFSANAAQKDELLQAFVTACSTGDAVALEKLLARDVIARSDGGGKVLAALKPVYGPDRVTRFLLGTMKKFPPGAWPEIVVVNGARAIVLRDATGVRVVVEISVADEHITDVFIVNNPDKLTRIDAVRGD